MKKILVIVSVTVLATSAFGKTSSMTCKNIQEASSQGYEAIVTPSKAKISNKGSKVAKLSLVRLIKGMADEVVGRVYSENKAGGLELVISEGAVTGVPTAVLSQNGFAGSTVIANLNDCKK